MVGPGQHRVVGLVIVPGAVHVGRALAALVVEHAVRVQRDGVLLDQLVLEQDLDRVADLGPDDRAEEAKVLVLQGRSASGGCWGEGEERCGVKRG